MGVKSIGLAQAHARDVQDDSQQERDTTGQKPPAKRNAHQSQSVLQNDQKENGHKVALKDMAVGDTVVKYGIDMGKVVAPITVGQHAHVHNIKTKRW